MREAMPLEPNPAPGRVLTAGFINEQARHHEWEAACGRQPGLLSLAGRPPLRLPYLDPPDVLNLHVIQAIGERGFPIVAGAAEDEVSIRALDTSALAIGRHRVYACLAHDKVPCGEVIEQAGSSGTLPARIRRFRRPAVVLAADDARLEHRDWIAVAELDRVREGGVVRTCLDTLFHPAIRDMRAYCLPNPLERLARQGLAAFDAGGSPPVELRRELSLLLSIADAATPEQAFVQVQRCVHLLRDVDPPPLQLDNYLLGFRYDPDTFCGFLAHLASCLAAPPPARLPGTLEVDGIQHLRIAGELVEEDDFWCWSPDRDSFVASGLVLYLPGADPGSAPILRVGLSKTDTRGHFTAHFTSQLSAPGAAARLGPVPSGARRVYVTVNADQLRQRLRQLLGNGHALYYC